jgi:hypothetical protein
VTSFLGVFLLPFFCATSCVIAWRTRTVRYHKSSLLNDSNLIYLQLNCVSRLSFTLPSRFFLLSKNSLEAVSCPRVPFLTLPDMRNYWPLRSGRRLSICFYFWLLALTFWKTHRQNGTMFHQTCFFFMNSLNVILLILFCLSLTQWACSGIPLS